MWGAIKPEPETDGTITPFITKPGDCLIFARRSEQPLKLLLVSRNSLFQCSPHVQAKPSLILGKAGLDLPIFMKSDFSHDSDKKLDGFCSVDCFTSHLLLLDG